MIPRGRPSLCSKRRDPTESGRERVRHGEHVIEHLLRRAGFGASDDEIDDYLELGSGDGRPPAARLRERARRRRCADRAARLRRRSPRAASSSRAPSSTTRGSAGCSAWSTPQRPLQEKMTLFWHNHFATALHEDRRRAWRRRRRAVHGREAVRGSQQVKGQIELLREYALGNFRDLLIAVAKDPAMLVWLDGRTNVKGRPQENFARELMELFTMGVDTFAEDGRLRRRARLHRLEPGARPRERVLHVQLRRRRSTTPPRRSSRSRSIPTAARSIPARARRRGHAGRPRSDQRRRGASGDRPAAGAQAVSVLRQRGVEHRTRRSSPSCRASTTAANSRSKPVMRAAAAVAAVHATRRIATRGTRGRRSSSPDRSRKSAGPASR